MSLDKFSSGKLFVQEIPTICLLEKLMRKKKRENT